MQLLVLLQIPFQALLEAGAHVDLKKTEKDEDIEKPKKVRLQFVSDNLFSSLCTVEKYWTVKKEKLSNAS